MFHHPVKLSVYVFSLATVLVAGIIMPSIVYAGSGQIYLTPSSASEEVGSSFNVSLRINPGTNVNTVQATVTYDPSYIEFLSSSIGVFSSCVTNSGGGGSVTLACAILGSSTSSDSLIDNITFKAVASSGSSVINVTNANAAYAGAWTNPGSAGASITFTSPPVNVPPPPPTPAPRPVAGSTARNNTSSSSSTSANTTNVSPSIPTTTPQPPSKVSINVVSQSVKFTTAKILIRITPGVQLVMNYGTTKGALNNSRAVNYSGNMAVMDLGALSLVPGTTYYYDLVASFAGKVITTSQIESFTTEGYTIRVTVLDSSYRPIVGKIITLHSVDAKYAVTNNKGIATFVGVAPGPHDVEYTSINRTYSSGIYVPNNLTISKGIETANIQTDAVVLSGYRQPSSFPRWIYIIIIIILSITFGAVMAKYSTLGRRIVVQWLQQLKLHL